MTRATRIINGKRVPAYVGAPPRLRQSAIPAGEASKGRATGNFARLAERRFK